MSAVQTLTVAAEEADMRLDRWFKRRFPALGHGRLEKLLRTGQVRVDGGRAKSNTRLAAGQTVRVPPLPEPAERPARRVETPPSTADVEALQGRVLHRDASVIALNKPPGLAVQGGSKVQRHLDGMLDALRFGAPERPRLVHRLDKETSGVLLLARTAPAARKLTEAFRRRDTRKIYWAVTVRVPKPRDGTIDLVLGKRGGPGGEKMAVGGGLDAKRALTRYAVIERAQRKAAWVALWPLTGRTHQLRVHMAAIGTPVLGDGKYGGAEAFLSTDGLSQRLHLHARQLRLPHPDGGELDVTAPLPPHMAETWRFFGFSADTESDPFEDAVSG